MIQRENDIVNDLVVSGLDEILPAERAQKEILERVDSIIQTAVEEKDPDIAGNAIKSLLNISRISGLALAKFLYTFKFQWKNFNRRETFERYIEESVGRQKTTINRYLRVWEMFVSGDIPREYREKLKLHSIKSLIPISNLSKQGYELSVQNWKELADAPNVAEVNKIIRKIKKKEPKKGSLQIEWNSEEKQLTMWKNNKPHYVYLQYDETDEIVMAGLDRLFGEGRVLEK